MPHTIKKLLRIQSYLDMTGQDEAYLYKGTAFYDLDYIVSVILPQALRRKKQIVWATEDSEEKELHYELKDLVCV